MSAFEPLRVSASQAILDRAYGKPPTFKAPDFDWQLIEEAYGHALSQPVRQKIQEVTIEYASDAIFELTVAPVADPRKDIGRILAAAEQLRDAMN